MEIAIDDGHLDPLLLRLQLANRDGHVVDVTESLGVVRKGMVKASAQIDRATPL